MPANSFINPTLLGLSTHIWVNKPSFCEGLFSKVALFFYSSSNGDRIFFLGSACLHGYLVRWPLVLSGRKQE